MSIKRGHAWGDTGPFPANGVLATSDAQVRDFIVRWNDEGSDFAPIALGAGDLCATLGGRGGPERFAALRSSASAATTLGSAPPAATSSGPPAEFARVVIDVGQVSLDGHPPTYFVAHCIARRSWWRGRVVAVMNAAWLGSWNVAPQAHPGDGRFDVVDANLAPGDKLKARKRLLVGTHVPHPQIAVRRIRETEIEFDRPTPVWLDGQRCGVARTLRVTVVADALRVFV